VRDGTLADGEGIAGVRRQGIAVGAERGQAIVEAGDGARQRF
jgi:hypothetical protein